MTKDVSVSSAQPGSITNPTIGDTAPIVPAANTEEVKPQQQVTPTGGTEIDFGIRGRTVNEETHKLKALVYGAHGVGKTLLATSAADVAEMSDVLVIAAEGGSVVAAGRFSRKVREIPVTSYDQVNNIYKWFKAHLKARAEQNDANLLALHNAVFKDEPLTDAKKVPRFNTIVLDSVSELQKYVMMKLQGTGSSTTNVDLSAEPDQARFAEWGKGGDMIRSMLRAFRDLPVHVIFVASLNEKEDEIKRKFLSPNLPGKLAKDVQGFVDFVGMMLIVNNVEVDNPDKPGEKKVVSVRRTIIAPGDRWDAKSRLKAHEGKTHFDNARMSDIVKGVIRK